MTSFLADQDSCCGLPGIHTTFFFLCSQLSDRKTCLRLQRNFVELCRQTTLPPISPIWMGGSNDYQYSYGDRGYLGHGWPTSHHQQFHLPMSWLELHQLFFPIWQPWNLIKFILGECFLMECDKEGVGSQCMSGELGWDRFADLPVPCAWFFCTPWSSCRQENMALPWNYSHGFMRLCAILSCLCGPARIENRRVQEDDKKVDSFQDEHTGQATKKHHWF